MYCNVSYVSPVSSIVLDYTQVLQIHYTITYAFNPDYSSEFEILTNSLFISVTKFQSEHTKKIPGPDVVISDNDTGLIIDNKSSYTTVSIDRKYILQMFGYLTEAQDRERNVKAKWWKVFSENVNEYMFLFIGGEFSKEILENIRDIIVKSGNKASVIMADNLLLYFEKVKNGKIHRTDMFEKIRSDNLILDYHNN